MVEIAEATSEQLDELSILFEAYRDFYKQDLSLDTAKAFLTLRFQNRDSKIFVAKDEGKLVGFVQLYPLLDSLKLGNMWLLNDLYVDPECRGKGVSKLLLTRGKQLAKDTNSTGLLLDTQKTNTIGNKLYPSQGWKLKDQFNYYFWTSENFDREGSTPLLAKGTF